MDLKVITPLSPTDDSTSKLLVQILKASAFRDAYQLVGKVKQVGSKVRLKVGELVVLSSRDLSDTCTGTMETWCAECRSGNDQFCVHRRFISKSVEGEVWVDAKFANPAVQNLAEGIVEKLPISGVLAYKAFKAAKHWRNTLIHGKFESIECFLKLLLDKAQVRYKEEARDAKYDTVFIMEDLLDCSMLSYNANIVLINGRLPMEKLLKLNSMIICVWNASSIEAREAITEYASL